MPMLDVSNWLLLTTVLTTGGGRIPPLLVLEIFSLLLCGFFFRITLDTAKVHDQSAVTSHGHCCGKFVCVALSDFKFHNFELSFYGTVCQL
jgi:fucose permease